MIVAGDIGGTKTLLALAEVSPEGQPHIRHERRFNSGQYDDFAKVLQEFLEIYTVDPHTIQATCLGIAGPVEGNRGQTTNLPWQLDGAQIASQFSTGPVHLLNDFACIAYAIPQLSEQQFQVLQPGELLPQAPKVVLGPGTGLGVAYLTWDGNAYRVHSTEGGHSHFSATNEQQTELLLFLRKALGGRVSNERILSGPGLVNIFQYFYEFASEEQKQTVKGLLKTNLDLAQGISNMAKGGNILTNQSLDLFTQILAQTAGDLALTHGARGGIYLAGGITPKILSRLENETFLQTFNDKGRMAPLMQKMPLFAITEARVGLMGALHYAMHHR